MKSPANIPVQELEKIAARAALEADKEARAAGIEVAGIEAADDGKSRAIRARQRAIGRELRDIYNTLPEPATTTPADEGRHGPDTGIKGSKDRTRA